MAGGYGAGDPPDPIPNSEVKTRCADGTAGATRWESTAPPAFFYDKRPLRSQDRSGRLAFLSFPSSPRCVRLQTSQLARRTRRGAEVAENGSGDRVVGKRRGASV